MATYRSMDRLGRSGGWRSAVGVALALVATAAAAADNGWLRVTTPDFTVVTSLREKEAVAWAGDFAQYVAALRAFFHLETTRLPPLTVVIFARERDFEKYRPLRANGKAEEVGGFFSRQESWAVAGLPSVSVDEGVRRTIYHEGVHWFLSMQEVPNPVWLEEGLAEVFSTFEVTKNQAEWGRAIGEHVMLLREMRTLPLEQLLFTAHDDLFGDDTMRTGVVYAESWAFVHYAIFGKSGLSRHAIGDYAERIHAGTQPDEAFRQAFGKTYKEMDRQLRDYLSEGQYFVSRKPLVPVATPKAEPATKVDVEDALGRLALVAGRTELACAHARAAIAAAPDDPRGHEVLGFALQVADDPTHALAEFTFATAHGSKDFRPYFELACAAQTAAAGGLGSGLTMSPADARRVANGYQRAINLHPRYLAAYENLAGVIDAAVPFGPEDRRFLELGRRIYPESAMIAVGLAIVARREGDSVAAHAQLNQVIESKTASTNARAYAVRLDAAWEQQETYEQIDRLSAAGKYADALAFVDARLAAGVSGDVRLRLTTIRPQFQAKILSREVQESLQDKRWADARRHLGELIEADVPPPLKVQARRSLDELDRRHLGLEVEPKK